MNLNLIDDSGAKNLNEFYQKSLDAGAQGHAKYEAHLNLGLLAWRAQDPEAARAHLAAAARQAADLFAAAGAAESPRQPNDFDMPLMLGLVLGDAVLKERLARLPRRNWFRPEQPEYRPLADLFDVLRRFPIDKTLDAEAIRKVLESNDGPQAQIWYKPWIKAMGEGLLAVREKDKDAVEGAIQALLKLHEKEAEEGDWKYLVEGLMATWAMVLYRFARDAGMDIKVESPYFNSGTDV